MYDYHVHSGYTGDVDKDVSIKKYIEYAEKIGIKEICFTNHLEFHPIKGLVKGYTILPKEIPSYIDEVDKYRDNYNISLLTGLEISYVSKYHRVLENILNEYEGNFDLIIGSIHHLHNIDITARDPPYGLFKRKGLMEIYAEYFDILVEAIESQLFDVIGHPDVIRKHAVKYYGEDISSSKYIYLIIPVIESLKEYNVGIEVNTSAKRHDLETYYPRPEFLKMYRNINKNIIIVGSDAHRIIDLGYDFPNAYKMLINIGFKYIARFKGRRIIDRIELYKY